VTDFSTPPNGQGAWLETPYTFDDTFPVGEYAAVPGMGTTGPSESGDNPWQASVIVCRLRGHNGHNPFAELFLGFQVVGVYPTTVGASIPVSPAIPDYVSPVSDFDSACVVGGADGGAHPWTDETVEATSLGVSFTAPTETFTYEGTNYPLTPSTWHIQPVAKISAFDADHPPVLTYALVAAVAPS
jgi:hypothetical protein